MSFLSFYNVSNLIHGVESTFLNLSRLYLNLSMFNYNNRSALRIELHVNLSAHLLMVDFSRFWALFVTNGFGVFQIRQIWPTALARSTASLAGFIDYFFSSFCSVIGNSTTTNVSTHQLTSTRRMRQW